MSSSWSRIESLLNTMYATQAMSNHVQINILKKAMRSLHFHVSHFKYLYVSVLVGNACANMMTQYFSN